MDKFIEKLKVVFGDKNLRNRVYFVLGALIIFRFLSSIPIAGVDKLKLDQLLTGNQFLGFLNIFSGGGLSTLSIVMLGVGPYITGSIIMQLLTIIFPKLKEMYQEDGEAGRKKFVQYSRLLTVPLAIFQGFGLLFLLRQSGVVVADTVFDQMVNIIVVTGGSVLVMWIGELMTEYGIGNGTSIIIFAGIIAQMPSTIGQMFASFTVAQIPTYLVFLVVSIIIIAGVVIITEAERPVPVTYAKRVRGAKMYGGVSTYLPIRLNQAGVMPIIFALSLLLLPQMIATFLLGLHQSTLQAIGTFLRDLVANQLYYAIFYFLLVFLFTYFYTAITFDPDNIATNLQKNGAFIPGVRPGKPTAEHLSRILVRVTFVGALFLGIIAVLPLGIRSITGITALSIGGTSLLIVVSVVLDLIKQMNAQISMREY
ncbi:MAG: preprotein translocase subunit SecY [Candidatus Paceibacterota bacterium]|jgi:preprotein translocase subunit SecY